MTVGVRPDDCAAFEALAALHEVEATVVGTFTDSGALLFEWARMLWPTYLSNSYTRDALN